MVITLSMGGSLISDVDLFCSVYSYYVIGRATKVGLAPGVKRSSIDCCNPVG